MDIVIKALETFVKSEHEWFLTKSKVELNYFVVSNSTGVLAQSLHYDFVDRGQGNHPFFHVQLTDELIHENDIRSTYCDLELPQAVQSSQCWVTTRIPTPDMTLPSMLYCLVADHLGESIFVQFAEKVHPILQDRLPHPNFDLLKDSLQEPLVHFKSSHWFAHMRKSDDQNG